MNSQQLHPDANSLRDEEMEDSGTEQEQALESASSQVSPESSTVTYSSPSEEDTLMQHAQRYSRMVERSKKRFYQAEETDTVSERFQSELGPAKRRLGSQLGRHAMRHSHPIQTGPMFPPRAPVSNAEQVRRNEEMELEMKRQNDERERATDAELAQLFAKQEREPRPAVPLRLKLFTYRRLDEKAVLRLIYFRYESLTDFTLPCRSIAEVARLTKTPETTVRYSIRRFHKRGNKFQSHAHLQGASMHNRKLTPALSEFLASQLCLREWKGRTLLWRVTEIDRLFNIRVEPRTLCRFYNVRGIRHRYALHHFYQKRSEEQTFEERKVFARRLATLIKTKNKYLLYMDEASFQSWDMPKRTWSTREKPIVFSRNQERDKGVTVFGAIGESVQGFAHQISASTNTVDFIRFLNHIRRKSRVPRDKRLYLVMDNHNAHKGNGVEEAAVALCITFVLMTTYSPEFNPVETVWGIAKKQVRIELAQSDRYISPPLFLELLTRIMGGVSNEQCQKIARTAHRAYIYKHLTEQYNNSAQEE